jgi:hypothetical protein
VGDEETTPEVKAEQPEQEDPLQVVGECNDMLVQAYSRLMGINSILQSQALNQAVIRASEAAYWCSQGLQIQTIIAGGQPPAEEGPVN